jgi:hypothetical protein
MVFLRKYNTATGTGTHVRVPMIKRGAIDFATGSDWTPAAGDVKVSKDGGSQANIGTLPTFTNGAWEFQFTGSELSAKQLEVMIVDSATKVVEDQCFLIETYGHASAMYQADLSAANLPAATNTIANAAIDAIITRPTSGFEAAVKSNPKCLGGLIETGRGVHKSKDDGAGNILTADAADSYAGANKLTQPIVATDSALVAIKELGTNS